MLQNFYKTLKSIHSAFNPRIIISLLLVVAASLASVAQTVDYNLPRNWMCHPALKSTDIARRQELSITVRNPDNTIKTVINYTRDTLVDIFYIYPTIDMDFHSGNTPMEGIDTNTAQFVYREQAGIYAKFGRVFAPYYRQAKIGVFVTTSLEDSVQLKNAEYMKLAYNDIDSAFNHYLKYYNKGRKIILIGHSQGSDHERFLLRNRFDNNPVLLSQLVVAISGGEPNYTSISGSRTGGSLQNVKSFPPQDSLQESGCVMNWRTWNKDSLIDNLNKTSFYFNQHFADTGLIYKIYDTINHTHIEAHYDYGYSTPAIMPRFISLDSTMTGYVAFDSMFRAEVTSDPSIPGSSYILIDTVYTPDDHRRTGSFPGINSFLQGTIPIPATKNYHIWDMQFVQWDLLNLLPNLISITHPITSVSELNNLKNSVQIYPNPTTGTVHIASETQKIKSIKLYNSLGVLVEEYFTNDFSVSDQVAGIYFVTIQTDKSIFTQKLVKQ